MMNIEKTMEALRAHNMEVYMAKDREEAKKIALSLTELFNDSSYVIVRNVKRYSFHRLALDSVKLLEENSGVRAEHLISLAAHRLDKYGKVHLAASRNLKFIGSLTVGYTK